MRKLRSFALLVVLLAVSVSAMAQRAFDVNLWDAKTPNKNGLQDTAYIKVFLPDAKRATGRAVVICPGGGYARLAMDHEGTQWAPFFNNMGIATIVLHYRMPNGNAKVPISDAEEALRTVRRNAKNWHINASDIGIMGFSAGGHLASTIATQSKGDAKPNFQILFYPVITMMQGYTHQGSHDNLLGYNASKKDEQKFCSDLQVTRVTPRACLLLSDDDHAVLPINSVNYYAELYRHDVPASIYVYPTGGHGWGMNTSFAYHSEMLLNLKGWLESF
ncbi:alpha/beta hydrolase [Prevotella sp.]|uniref:alpha/beta hydrolase n=1 Tax=uncultured Prevotella sp. TaxID=159272 RepID=UPI0025F03337|nr:alpha/beta hydrolase [uncultured Prevotella sp.]